MRRPEASHKVRSGRRSAAVGSGLVAKVTASPDAPLDKLLDLRGDLSRSIGGHSAAVVRLSSRVTAAPFDGDLPVELDERWTNGSGPPSTRWTTTCIGTGWSGRLPGPPDRTSTSCSTKARASGGGGPDRRGPRV